LLDHEADSGGSSDRAEASLGDLDVDDHGSLARPEQTVHDEVAYTELPRKSRSLRSGGVRVDRDSLGPSLGEGSSL